MSVWDSVREVRAAAALAEIAASGDMPHALLLAGPSGSGKAAAAVALAAAVNCPRAPGRGCGACSMCDRIVRRRHPDVHHIVPEGPVIPVDVVRDAVVAEASRSPFEARSKVFVIGEAERMNEAAQNSLLKTLEEPPPDTVLVLVTEAPEELLETVRSRCRRVLFEPLAPGSIVDGLVAAGVDEDRARLAARIAQGNRDRALALALDDDARSRRALWLDLPDRLRSYVDALDAGSEVVSRARAAVAVRERIQRAEVEELAEALGEGRGTAAARGALAKRHRRELRRVEEDVLTEALGSIASFYRDVVALRRGASEAVVNVDARDRLEVWAREGPADRELVAAAVRVLEASAALPKNANVPLAVEAALVELARLVRTPGAAP